jgi:hypothetical protein
MLEVKNKEYEAKITDALMDAITRASIDPTTNTSVMLSGDIVSACITVIALMAGTSNVTRTPRLTREFAEDCAREIKRKIAHVKEHQSKGGLDFINVVHADERH